MSQSLTLHIPSLDEERDAVDLMNALMGVNGISGVRADPARRLLTVEFEPDFATGSYIERVVRKSGYPIEENGARER